jgi:hypothetical protein
MITNLNPIEIEEKIKSVTDYLGYPVDKGIFRSVVILNSLGFTTNQSCEGHFNRYNTYPWIDIKFKTKTQKEKESALIMAKLIFQNLNEFYKKRNNCAYDESIFLRKIFESDKEFTIRISQKSKRKF